MKNKTVELNELVIEIQKFHGFRNIKEIVLAIRESDILDEQTKISALKDIKRMTRSKTYAERVNFKFEEKVDDISGMFIWSDSKLGHFFWTQVKKAIR